MKKAMSIIAIFVLVAAFVTMAFVVPSQKVCPAGGCHPSEVIPCVGNVCTKDSVLHFCGDGGCYPSELIPCEGDICVRN